MKITVEELNDAYCKVNEMKINGFPIRDIVEVTIDRNPLIDHETSLKLTFKLHPKLGPKGSYVLDNDDIEIIDDFE